jgi:GNAT superfamily N-acetyltransferase
MVINIRKAVPDDAHAACSLLRRSIEQGCEADHGGRPEVLAAWLGNKTPENVSAWFLSSSNHALVAECDGEIAGLALLTQAGKVSLCYVLPGALRTGVGRALLGALEDQARTWSIRKLSLHSPASASGFFERNGYLNAGKDKSCFGLDCDLLWKQLDAADCDTDASARKRFCNCL